MTSHVESVVLDDYVGEPLDEDDPTQVVLALYHDGVLHVDDTAAVRAHLEVCAQCADFVAALGGARELLEQTSVPPLGEELIQAIADRQHLAGDVPSHPLPESVIQDCDAALAAEPPVQAPDGDADPAAVPKVLPLVPKSHTRRWTPYLVAAAAAVFLIGGGVAGVNTLFHDAPPTGTESHAGGDKPPAARDYNSPPVVESGTEYTSGSLAEDAGGVINRYGLDPRAAADAGDSEPQLERAAAYPEELDDCAKTIEDDTGIPAELVDMAQYEGEDAWIIISPTSSEEEYAVRVVPATCGTSDDSASEPLAETTVSVE